MWYWGHPQFFGVRAAAANVSHGKGDYTLEQFQEDYPQFFNAEGNFLGSMTMLQEIINMANLSIQPDRWGESWRYAVGLYVAHYATLSLRSYAASNEDPSQAAGSGALTGVVSSEEKVIDGLDAHFTGRSDVIPVERKRDGQPGARSSLLSGGEFRVISDYVNLKIRQIGTEILEGRIPLNPYRQAGGGQGACTYCPYSRVCGFDRRIPGYEDRTLEKLEEKEALRRMEQALEETGGEAEWQ